MCGLHIIGSKSSAAGMKSISRAGTSADLIKSQFGIMRYVSGYASKSDQTKPGCKVGRYWGIIGRAKIPWAKEQVIELSSAQAKLVRRTARRYMQRDEPSPANSVFREIVAQADVRCVHA